MRDYVLQENWFYILEKELEKVTSFYREKKREAMMKFNTLKEQLSISEEPHSRNNLNIYIGKRKNGKELKLAFSEFYLSLIIIQDYQKYNFVGFRKINKKFDKNLHCSLGKEWFERKVQGSDMDDGKDIDNLIDKVEILFTTELEKGDKKKAMTRLRVPPFESKKTDWSTIFLGFTGGVFLVLILVILASSMIMNSSRKVPNNTTEIDQAVNGYLDINNEFEYFYPMLQLQ